MSEAKKAQLKKLEAELDAEIDLLCKMQALVKENEEQRQLFISILRYAKYDTDLINKIDDLRYGTDY